jgi:hypothetical protein
MTTITLRNKLAEYIRFADEKKIKAIYTMVEDEIEEKHDIWTKEFTKEMDKRIKRFEEGKDKGKDSEIVVKNLLKLVTSK